MTVIYKELNMEDTSSVLHVLDYLYRYMQNWIFFFVSSTTVLDHQIVNVDNFPNVLVSVTMTKKIVINPIFYYLTTRVF